MCGIAGAASSAPVVFGRALRFGLAPRRWRRSAFSASALRRPKGLFRDRRRQRGRSPASRGRLAAWRQLRRRGLVAVAGYARLDREPPPDQSGPDPIPASPRPIWRVEAYGGQFVRSGHPAPAAGNREPVSRAATSSSGPESTRSLADLAGKASRSVRRARAAAAAQYLGSRA